MLIVVSRSEVNAHIRDEVDVDKRVEEESDRPELSGSTSNLSRKDRSSAE
jgi:hypothetical protein